MTVGNQPFPQPCRRHLHGAPILPCRRTLTPAPDRRSALLRLLRSLASLLRFSLLCFQQLLSTLQKTGTVLITPLSRFGSFPSLQVPARPPWRACPPLAGLPQAGLGPFLQSRAVCFQQLLSTLQKARRTPSLHPRPVLEPVAFLWSRFQARTVDFAAADRASRTDLEAQKRRASFSARLGAPKNFSIARITIGGTQWGESKPAPRRRRRLPAWYWL
jgi:hypothetical protein